MRKKIVSIILLAALLFANFGIYAVAMPLGSVADRLEQNNAGTSAGNSDGAESKFASEVLIGDGVHAVTARYEKGTALSLGVDPDTEVWTIVNFAGDCVMDAWKNSASVLPFSEYLSQSDGSTLREALEEKHRNFKNAAQQAGYEFEYSYSYTVASNGLAVKMPYASIPDVTEMPGVESVSLVQSYALPDTAQSYSSGTGGAVLGTSPQEGSAYDGTGMFVAVLDSGLDLSHAAFNGANIDLNTAKVTAENISNIIKSTDAAYFYWYSGAYTYLTADPETVGQSGNVYHGNKVVFAYDYGNNDTGVLPLAGYLPVMDHGTHTTGLLTGYATDGEGNVVFSGVLPQAQLAFMKVFRETDDGIYADDTSIAAAIEDAIMLNVDAINISLGSACGFATATESDNYIALLTERAASVGISVQVAAGNEFSSAYQGVSSDYPLASNPDYGSVTSPASYGYTLAVGSYDGSKTESYRYYFDFDGYKCFYTEASAFPDLRTRLGEGSYGWMLVTRGTYSDFEGAAGKICVVFVNDEVDIGIQYVNAYRHGAKAVMFVDTEYRTQIFLENNVYYEDLPYCYLTRQDGELLCASGTRTSGTVTVSEANYGVDLMSIFSAWGCTNALTLKPEIVAVGGNVWSTLITSSSYSVYSNTSGFNMDYGYMSGTSMAAPIATGYVVQMRQYLASLGISDPIEQQRIANALLMSTANLLYDVNGKVYSPRYQGAGAADVAAALNTPAYLEVVGSEKPKAELGDDPDKTGSYTVNFRIVNASDREVSYLLDLIVMTDSLMPDGKTNALTAKLLTDTEKTVSVRNGTYQATTGEVTVAAHSTASVLVRFEISDAAKQYIDTCFPNGSYVEGYVTLTATETGGYDLSLPFLAFYGDWDLAPMMDASEYDEEEAANFASYAMGLYQRGYSSAPLGYYPYSVPQGYADKDFDPHLVSIGGEIAANSGAFYRLSYLYYGMLRNAQTVQYSIVDSTTGEVYTNYTVNQVPRASYSSGTGVMYPVVQKLSFGAGLASNTEVTVNVRAYLGYDSDEQNTHNLWSFNLYIDDEKPKLYANSDEKGIHNGIVYDEEHDKYTLVLNVYDNHYLSCIWLMTYGDDGYQDALDAPIPVDTSSFRPGELNRIEIDVTPYMDQLAGKSTLGIILEDGTRLQAGFSIPLLSLDYTPDEENNADLEAESIYADDNINLAVGYSSDLGITTSPGNAKYTMVSSNPSVAYIDEEHGVVVALKAGETTITVSSAKTSIERKVFVYEIADEWSFEVLTENSTNFSGNPANIGKAVVHAYYGDGTHVRIPRSVSVLNTETGSYEDVEVCAVDPYAFAGAWMIQYLYIPNTVNYIAWYAFNSCYGLETVEFESGSTLKGIGTHAFAGCSSLTQITLPAALETIAMSGFADCVNLKHIYFEAGSRMTEIGMIAFSNTGIEELQLPEGIRSIGGSAFSGCKQLRSFTAPSTLESIGGDAFAFCDALEYVDLTAAQVKTIGGAFRFCYSLKRIYGLNHLTSVASSTFTNCYQLTYVDLSDSVTEIGSYAFQNCYKLVEIYFGDSMTSIGRQAFENCVSLRTVRIGAGADLDFGVDAMYGCNAIESIIVHPNNTKHMSDNGVLYAYDPVNSKNTESEKVTYWYLMLVPGAKDLTEFHLRADVTAILSYAFAYHDEMQSFFIPDNSALESIGAYAFAGCTSLSYINLESARNLQGLGNYIFAYDVSLTEITIPCNFIGTGMFFYCVNLENINIPDTFTGVSAYGCAYCVNLKGFNGRNGLYLPSETYTITDYAFRNCRSLEVVDLSLCDKMNGDTNYWGAYAFYACTGLKKLVLNEHTYRIGEYCFYACTSLRETNLADCGELYHIGTYAFGLCSSLEEAYLPGDLRILGSYAFAGCTSLSRVTLPDSLGGTYSGSVSHQIQPYAFAGCSSLTEIELPWNLQRLTDYVFAESGLRSITIPGNVTSLSVRAFYLCTELEAIYVDDQRNEETGEYLLDGEGNRVPNLRYQSIDGVLATRVAEGSTDKPQLLLYPPAKYAEVYTIPDGFDTVPTNFFFLTSATGKVVIPSGVTTVADQAFYYADIEEVEFAADSAVDFDISANYGTFMYCSALKRVILPENITTIPEGMFYECNALEEVRNTSRVKYFGYMSFYDCYALKEIDLSSALAIGDSAFAYCESLEELNISACTMQISFGVAASFEGCKSLREVNVDSSNRYYMTVDNVIYNKEGTVLYLYPAAREDKTYTVPDGVCKISAYAFAYNGALESVVLPETVSSIGFAAFYKTSNLSTYVMKSATVPTLDASGSATDGMLYYCNFYDIYYLGFDIYLTLVRPAGASTYDNQWIYKQVFDKITDLEAPVVLDAVTGEEKSLDLDLTPAKIAVTPAGYEVVPGEEVPADAESYIARFNAYADRLASELGGAYDADFAALKQSFAEDLTAFADLLSAKDRGVLYSMYVREAELTAEGMSDLYVVKWSNIHDLLEYASYLSSTFAYQSYTPAEDEDIHSSEYLNDKTKMDFRGSIAVVAYSGLTVISYCTDVESVTYWHDVYRSILDSIPKYNDVDRFWEYRTDVITRILALSESLAASADLYTDEAYQYALTALSSHLQSAQQASSYYMLYDALCSAEALVRELVTASDAEAFAAYKAVMKAKLDVYRPENYAYGDWFRIQEYIGNCKEQIDGIYTYAEVYELVMGAIAEIDACETVLDAEKQTAIENLEYAVLYYYDMQHHVSDEVWNAIKALLNEAEEAIRAVSVSGICESVANGYFDEIWEIYLYNGNVYSAYRSAIGELERLSAGATAAESELIAATRAQLSALSPTNTLHYETIVSVMEAFRAAYETVHA